MNARTRAYSYIRMSTPEQIKGDSLRRQKEWSQKWCNDHGYTLDESLRLQDLGVSGFTGENAATGRLGAFLNEIREGRIQPGSLLLVESLDRLSREKVERALPLFLEILDADITIVTRYPTEQIFIPGKLDIVQLIIAIVSMGTAHESSAKGSGRLGEVWSEKRKNIDKTKITGKCPGWLKLNDNRTRFEPIPERVATVKRIFILATEGHGMDTITKTLNCESVPTLGYSGKWHRSYVGRILGNRSVFGEYQPHTGRVGNRKPVGDPIPDYYPAIISEEEFLRAQQALRARKNNTRGPIGANGTVANLFTGLVRDARDGATMTLVDKGKKSAGPYLVSSAASRGENGSEYISFPYRIFEDAMLHWTKELKASDLMPTRPDEISIEDRLANAEARLEDIEIRIEEITQEIIDGGEGLGTLATIIRTLEGRKQEAITEVEALKTALREQQQQPLEDARNLIKILETAKGDELALIRTRLKARLQDLITGIWVQVAVLHQDKKAKMKAARQALVQVHFRRGGYRRIIILVYKNSVSEWATEDLQEGDPEWYDLRTLRKS
jgi:DNA invertase Pin-like site-specific DNA recombinase